MARAAVLALGLLCVAGCGGATAELLTFSLTDQAGRVIRAEELRGRAVVVSFIFTTCVEACPIVTAQLVRVQALARASGLIPHVRFVSVSVDPITDTPARLREYARAYGADLDSWHFVTGDPEEIARLMQALAVGTAPGTRGPAHDAPVIFVDPAGRITDRHDALTLVPDEALAALRKLAG